MERRNWFCGSFEAAPRVDSAEREARFGKTDRSDEDFSNCGVGQESRGTVHLEARFPCRLLNTFSVPKVTGCPIW